MHDPVVYMSDVVGAGDRSDAIVRFNCLADDTPWNLEVQRIALPRLAALALQLAGSPPDPITGQDRPYIGLAPDSVEADPTALGAIMLTFGMGPGSVRFGLDRGQAVELLLLLQAAVKATST